MSYVKVTGGDKYEKILQKIADLKIGVKAGIPAGATTTDGKSIPEYALYNELGTRHIPARPFMKKTVDEHQNEWLDIIAGKLNVEAIVKDDAKNVMGLVGEVMQAHIKQTIEKGSFAPNARATIEAKRRKGKRDPDHPLIDTGQMMESVINEVVEE